MTDGMGTEGSTLSGDGHNGHNPDLGLNKATGQTSQCHLAQANKCPDTLSTPEIPHADENKYVT